MIDVLSASVVLLACFSCSCLFSFFFFVSILSCLCYLSFSSSFNLAGMSGISNGDGRREIEDDNDGCYDCDAFTTLTLQTSKGRRSVNNMLNSAVLTVMLNHKNYAVQRTSNIFLFGCSKFCESYMMMYAQNVIQRA
jgi:hypothetical protein